MFSSYPESGVELEAPLHFLKKTFCFGHAVRMCKHVHEVELILDEMFVLHDV